MTTISIARAARRGTRGRHGRTVISAVMVIVLLDGEEIEGTIEWYDRGALKVNRKSAPNLLLLKRNIKYMYKAGPE